MPSTGYRVLADELVTKWDDLASSIAAKIDDDEYDGKAMLDAWAETTRLSAETSYLMWSEAMDAAATLSGRQYDRDVRHYDSAKARCPVRRSSCRETASGASIEGPPARRGAAGPARRRRDRPSLCTRTPRTSSATVRRDGAGVARRPDRSPSRSSSSSRDLTMAPGPQPQGDLSARVGELRRLTFMYCDVVGSTELSGRQDLETYRELMRGYRDACRDVIESRFEGHIVHDQGRRRAVDVRLPGRARERRRARRARRSRTRARSPTAVDAHGSGARASRSTSASASTTVPCTSTSTRRTSTAWRPTSARASSPSRSPARW